MDNKLLDKIVDENAARINFYEIPKVKSEIERINRVISDLKDYMDKNNFAPEEASFVFTETIKRCEDEINTIWNECWDAVDDMENAILTGKII